MHRHDRFKMGDRYGEVTRHTDGETVTPLFGGPPVEISALFG